MKLKNLIFEAITIPGAGAKFKGNAFDVAEGWDIELLDNGAGAVARHESHGALFIGAARIRGGAVLDEEAAPAEPKAASGKGRGK